MKMYFWALLVSMLGLSSAALAQGAPTTIEGRTLIATENLTLTEMPDRKQVVYYTNENGEITRLGQITKIRAGTEFFHWGNGTPEQAESWDKAGKIPPDLLNRLRADNNFGALGGGFYASLSPTDSMSYGNVQIILRMPRAMKVLSEVAPYAVQGEQWNKVMSQLDRLGVSALQNQSQTTWFNIIDAEALTQEHVAKARDWQGRLERSGKEIKELMEKFPYLAETPSTKIEINRYLYHWKALGSSDQGRIYAAFRYFSSIRDIEGINYGLARINSSYKAAAIQELMKTYQTMTPDEKAYLLLSKNLKTGPLFQDVFNHALRETATPVRQAVFRIIEGRTDAQSRGLISAGTQDTNPILRQSAYSALSGRQDHEAIELLRRGFNDADPDVRNAVAGLIGKLTSRESLPLLKSVMASGNRMERLYLLSSLRDRQDQAALEILKMAVRDPEPQVRITALYVASARKGIRSLDIVRVMMKDSNSVVQSEALKMLYGRDDKESLKIIMTALQSENMDVRGQALVTLGRQKGNYADIFAKAFNDPNMGIRAMAAHALTGKTDSKSLALLFKAAENSQTQVRANAIRALAGRSDAKVVEIIKLAVSDTNRNINYAGLEAAKNIHGQDFAEIVTSAMKNPDEMVRYEALNLLNGRTDDFAFETLKAATMASELGVRMQAIEVFSHLQAPGVIEHLKILASDPDSSVKDTAIFALRELGQLMADNALDTTTPRGFITKLEQLKKSVQESIQNPRCEAVFSQ